MTPKKMHSDELRQQLAKLEGEQRNLLTALAVVEDGEGEARRARLKGLQEEAARLRQEIARAEEAERAARQAEEAKRLEEARESLRQCIARRDVAARQVEVQAEALRLALEELRRACEEGHRQVGEVDGTLAQGIFAYPAPEVYRYLAGRLFPLVPLVAREPLPSLVEALPRT